MSEGRKIMQVRSARQVPVRVQLLDDEVLDVTVDKRAVGWILFDKVCEHLNILEKDYFALNFINPEGLKYWLDQEKKVSKQMKGLQAWNLCFEVKFYPGDPLQMVEDLTRYQLCLQIRRDIVNERVPCSTVTYALLGSFTAQSELGDFEVEEFGSGSSYLKDLQFAPHQDRDLLSQIAKLHRSHKGLTPEDAELKFLENAKKLALYGVELHPAKDAEGKDIQLGVCASGILVYKDKQQVNRFVWPKILKMSYRRNKFYIKIRPGEFENFASLIGFRTTGIKMAKRLWKICVEHHSFFRFKEPEPVKSFSVIPRFGSRFRYSGRTQYQSRQVVSDEARDAPFFDRVLSKRGTFGGRTNNMRQRDDDRKRQRDEMRRAPPPPSMQDSKPQQNNGPKELYVEPKRAPPESKRTPPEPRHAPPIAPKPKPNVAPKPKPSPRGPSSVDDNASLDRGSRGSLNDSFEDLPDRKSKMEKMHAVMTPLAMVMQKSLDKKKLDDSDEEDRHSYNNNVDDKYEVGMRAQVARTRSGLINTNKGCRSNNGYLFSYPSSSVDSILSKDFDEYAADNHQYQSHLEHKVASDEHLNASGHSRKKIPKQEPNRTGFSQSAENILFEGNVSHYAEIDPVVAPDGIYAEVDEVKTNNFRNPNKLICNEKKPSSIRGRRSYLFKPNQKHHAKTGNENKTESASLKPHEGEVIETMLRQNEKERGKSLKNPQPLTSLYSQVNKKRKKPLTPDISKLKEQITIPNNPERKIDPGSDFEISPVEPHYDTIDNIKETSHKRQDSQTSQVSLKEELKMYIITPEKLRQNSDASTIQMSTENCEQYATESCSQTRKEKLKSNHTDEILNTDQNRMPKNLQSNTDIRVNEKCKADVHTFDTMSKDINPIQLSQNETTQNDKVGKSIGYEQTEFSPNAVEPVYHNTDLDDKKMCEKEQSEYLGSIPARSVTSLYQLTFDTCSHNSNSTDIPDSMHEELCRSDDIIYLQTNDSEKEQPYISNISCDSDINNSFIHDSSQYNSERLEESLEMFCSLSSDSSDIDHEPYTFIRGESKRFSSSVKRKLKSDKDRDLKIQGMEVPGFENHKGLSNASDVKKNSVPSKPMSVLKNVTNLVKKVPVFSSSKSSKKKGQFVCEEFESEPSRRVAAPISDSSTSCLLEDKHSTSLKDNLPPERDKGASAAKELEIDKQSVSATSDSAPTSDLHKSPFLENENLNTPSEHHTNKVICSKEFPELSKISEGEQRVMDFFVRPSILEDFHNTEIIDQNSPQSNINNFTVTQPESSVSETEKCKESPRKKEKLFNDRDVIVSSLVEDENDNNECNLRTKDDHTCSHAKGPISEDLTQFKHGNRPDPFWYKTHLLPYNSKHNKDNVSLLDQQNGEKTSVVERTEVCDEVQDNMSTFDKLVDKEVSNVKIKSENDTQHNESHSQDRSVLTKEFVSSPDVSLQSHSQLESAESKVESNNAFINEREIEPEFSANNVCTKEIESGPEIKLPKLYSKGIVPVVRGSKVFMSETEIGPEIKMPTLQNKITESGSKMCSKKTDSVPELETELEISQNKVCCKETENGQEIRRQSQYCKEPEPEVRGNKVFIREIDPGPVKGRLNSMETEPAVKGSKVFTKKTEPEVGGNNVLINELETGPEIRRPILSYKKIVSEPNLKREDSDTLPNTEGIRVYRKETAPKLTDKSNTVQTVNTSTGPVVKSQKVCAKEIETGSKIKRSLVYDIELDPEPVVKGSKVFIKKTEKALEIREVLFHTEKSKPVVGNLKPIDKSDYTSDTSASVASLSRVDLNAKVSSNKSFETKGNKKSGSSDVTPKTLPGVVHMVRPAPASWIEGGLSLSAAKESRKQPVSKHFVSVLDPEPLPTTVESSLTYSVLDFDGTSSSGDIGNESQRNMPFDVQIENDNNGSSTHTDLEEQDNTLPVSVQSGPVTELLCKRVWKYPKNKGTYSGENNVNDFMKAVEKGPEDNEQSIEVFCLKETGMSSQKYCRETEGRSEHDINNANKDMTCLKEDLEDETTVSSQQASNFGCLSASIADEEHYITPIETKDLTHIENIVSQIKVDTDNVLNQDQYQQHTLETDIDSLDSNQQIKENFSNDIYPPETITSEFLSEKYLPYIDTSSDEENSTDTNESEDEIVSFEMPKPSGDAFKSEITDSDITFVDENNDKLETIGLAPLSGFAIDCSLEDVTIYKVSDSNDKSQENNPLPVKTTLYSNTISTDDDRYDVNYWDEDIGFDDYDDGFTIQDYVGTVPEIVDNTPYITKRSNLKNTLRRETTFSERRVHFPGNLPVYKSKKNVQHTIPYLRSDEIMNAANEENNKIHHLEQFIFGLFDEEPRNRSIPRIDSNPNPVTTHTRTSQETPPYFAPASEHNTHLGFHSALTFENVNFSLSPLEYYSFDDRDKGTDVITTDLDDIDYNDEGFDPFEDCPTNPVNTWDMNRYNKQASARIVKPVTRRKSKYLEGKENDPLHMDFNVTKTGTSSSLSNVDLTSYDDKQENSKQSGSSVTVENNNGKPTYMSQCSAELTSSSGVNDNSTKFESTQMQDSSCQQPISQLQCTSVESVSPLQVDKVNANRYVDVSELGKNTSKSHLSLANNSSEKEESLPCKVPADKITTYSYSYPDNSDPESPKIKYVTYEYVTEYKLNNVKIQYQHNKKIQTDSKLLDSSSGTEDEAKGISTESKRDSAVRKANARVGTEYKSNDNTSNENAVLEEAVEPFIMKTFCTPLGEDAQNESNENLGTGSSNIENISHLIDKSIDGEEEVLEEAVEPFIMKTFSFPLGERDSNKTCTEIEVEEVMEQAVCYPLGPIEGASWHPMETGNVIEEHIERSVCHTLGKQITSKDLGGLETTSDCGTRNKTFENTCVDNNTDDSKEQSKSLHDQTPNCSSDIDQDASILNDDKALPKHSERKVLGKGYTEKHMVEYDSEKYVFQCYQPSSYACDRFPKYLPKSFQNRDCNYKNTQSRNEHLSKNTGCNDKMEHHMTHAIKVSPEKLSENGLPSDVTELSKDLQDSGYETYTDEHLIESETDTEDQLIELEAMEGNDNLYSEIMQEELPNLHVEDSIEEKLLIVQAMFVVTLGAVLVFILPYMG